MNELTLNNDSILDPEIVQRNYQDVTLNLFPWTKIGKDETKRPEDFEHFFQLYAQYRSFILESYAQEIKRYWCKYEDHYCDEKLEMIGVRITMPGLRKDEYDLLLQVIEQDLLVLRDFMNENNFSGFEKTELADVISAGNIIVKKTVQPCYLLKFQKKENHKINTR